MSCCLVGGYQHFIRACCIRPEDGGRVSPNHLLDYMVSQPRRSVLRIAHPRTETIIMYDNMTKKNKHACVICQ